MKIAWELSSLLKRKLWIVTGKGGVGKTTLAAALGLLAASEGLKVLLVETHGLTHLGELMGVGAVGYEPTKARSGIQLIQINPEDAFEEYVLQQIRFKFLYNTVFNNKYVRHFVEGAPGLTELLTIGKIWALVEQKAQRKKRAYDLVVVVAPSTGHGLSLLTISQVVVDAVRMGPLHSKAKDILDLLRNPQKTLVWLVTLPEEMPVNEAVEMEEKLERRAKMELGPVLLNSQWPSLLSPDTLTELKGAGRENEMLRVYQKRLTLSRFYAERLQERLFEKQILGLPLVYQQNSPLKIAEHLAQAIKTDLLQKARHAVNQ